VLDAAYAHGVRYFDAARSYGRAEEFLSSWLDSRGIAPGDVTVGSKWGYTYTADWRADAEVHEVKEHSAAVLERQWRESSGHLGGYLNVPKSTRRPSTAACSTSMRCWTNSPV